MASTGPRLDSAGASRRRFLRVCALASGALTPIAAPPFRRALAQQPPAAKPGAETPKKGGTLRVGFYIEAVTMDAVEGAVLEPLFA